MSRPTIVDFFSCAGLYADGLRDAGFDVYCVDNDPRALRHNPHSHELGDALKLMKDKGFMRQFDAAHASPPCQGYSATRKLADAQGKGAGRAVDLVPITRELLSGHDIPWTIENVERSPLKGRPGVVKLCGSSFGLEVQRHRLFEPSPGLSLIDSICDHKAFPLDPDSGKPRPWGVYYAKGDRIPSGGRTVDTLEQGHAVMGIEHRRVPWKYLCEGLPPVYGHFIGSQMLYAVEN